MELASVLTEFGRDPTKCERLLKEREQTNCSVLAVELCEISRPHVAFVQSIPVSEAVRTLALVVLQQICERHWNVSAAYLKRVKQPAHVIRVGDAEKQRIQESLLHDVQLESSNACAGKRAQLIAQLAKYEWVRWPALFETLLGPSVSTPVAVNPGTPYGSPIRSTPVSQQGDRPTLRLVFTLHCVLKELSNQRIGSNVETFTKIAIEAFPKLCHQLSLIIHHTVNFESMPDTNAELATWICKSIMSLIRGSGSIAQLVVAPHFELVLASLSLKPNTLWTQKLIRTLRKTCIVTMKSHPKIFGEHYLSVFAERTIQCLSPPDAIGNSLPQQEEEKLPLVIFCYAFWTEALLQKFYHSPNSVLDKGLPLVARSALVHLRLTNKDLQQWKSVGGEQYCLQEEGDAVDVLMVKPGKDDTVRKAARRFLQACFDQPMSTRADLALAEIFGTQYSDTLAIEAAFFAVQLCSFRLHGKWNFDHFLRNRLLPCLISPRSTSTAAAGNQPGAPSVSTSSAIESACLARRACYVIQAWIADLTPDSLPLVYSTLLNDVLGKVEEHDLGVCLAAVDTLHSLVMDSTSFQPLAFFQCLSFPSICGSLYQKLRLIDAKVKVLQFLEDILLTVTRKSPQQEHDQEHVFASTLSASNGPAAMIYAKTTVDKGAELLLSEFVPFALKREEQQTAEAQLSNDDNRAFVQLEILQLAQVCVQVTGFANLSPRGKDMCCDLLRFFMLKPIHNDGEMSWAPFLLVCLKTSSELWSLAEFLRPACLSTIRDVRIKCSLVETASLLYACSNSGSNPELDFVAVVTELTDILLAHHHPRGTQGEGKGTEASLSIVGKELGVLSRTEQEQPFLVLYVCRCLEMVCRSKVCRSSQHHGLCLRCWERIVNSSVTEELHDDRLDSRDVIERLTLAARLVLTETAFFNSLESATAFARLCAKYIDAVGFAPSEAPWRRRLWTSALLVGLSRCQSVPETEAILPSALICVAAVVGESSDPTSTAALPCFSSVDESVLLADCVDLDASRREKLFRTDEFLAVDMKATFRTVWNVLVARFGTEKLGAIVATVGGSVQVDSATGRSSVTQEMLAKILSS